MDNVSAGKINAAVLRAEDQARAEGYQRAVNEVERALHGGESTLFDWLLAARGKLDRPGAPEDQSEGSVRTDRPGRRR